MTAPETFFWPEQPKEFDEEEEEEEEEEDHEEESQDFSVSSKFCTYFSLQERNPDDSVKPISQGIADVNVFCLCFCLLFQTSWTKNVYITYK